MIGRLLGIIGVGVVILLAGIALAALIRASEVIDSEDDNG